MYTCIPICICTIVKEHIYCSKMICVSRLLNFRVKVIWRSKGKKCVKFVFYPQKVICNYRCTYGKNKFDVRHHNVASLSRITTFILWSWAEKWKNKKEFGNPTTIENFIILWLLWNNCMRCIYYHHACMSK